MPSFPQIAHEGANRDRDIERRLRALESTWVRPETAASGYELLPKGAIKRQTLTASSSLYIVDTDTDMLLSNVPVTAGRIYGIHLHSFYELNSVNINARWYIYLKINGALYDIFKAIGPRISSGAVQDTLDSTVYWVPTVSAITDDLLVHADEAADGADLQFLGAATFRRTLTLIDYGVAP